MFDPFCPTCDRRMLLGSRRIEHVENTPEGPVAFLRCFCDTTVAWPATLDHTFAVDESVPAHAR